LQNALFIEANERTAFEGCNKQSKAQKNAQRQSKQRTAHTARVEVIDTDSEDHAKQRSSVLEQRSKSMVVGRTSYLSHCLQANTHQTTHFKNTD
jgi:hypothetical protein